MGITIDLADIAVAKKKRLEGGLTVPGSLNGLSEPEPAPALDLSAIAEEKRKRVNAQTQVKEAANLNYNLGSENNPETEATVLDLSKRTGWAPNLIRDDLTAAHKQANKPDWDKLDPATVSFLAKNPMAGNIAHDDVTNLDNLSRGATVHLSGRLSSRDSSNDAPLADWWGEFSSSVRNIPGAYRQGELEREQSMIGYRRMTGAASEDDLKRLDQLRAMPPQTKEYENWIPSGVTEFTKMLGQTIVPGMSYGAKLGISSGVAAGTVAGLVSSPSGPFAGIPALTAATTVGTAATTAGMVQDIYMGEAGQAYNEFADIIGINGEKLDSTVIKLAAAGYGVVSSGLEYLGGHALALAVPGMDRFLGTELMSKMRQSLASESVQQALLNVAKKYAIANAGEVTTEVAQEASQILIGELAKASSPGQFNPVSAKDVSNRLLETAVKTLQATSVGGLPGTAYNAVADTRKHVLSKIEPVVANYREKREAERWLGDQLKINDLVNKTKTKERSPELAEEFLRDHVGMKQEVAVDGEAVQTLYQDLKPVLDKVGITEDDVGKAVALGQDLKVPLARLHASLSAEEFARVAEVMKRDPADKSYWKLTREVTPEKLDEQATLYQERKDDDAAFKAELDRLAYDMRFAGFDEKQVASNIALVEAFGVAFERKGGNRVEALKKIIEFTDRDPKATVALPQGLEEMLNKARRRSEGQDIGPDNNGPTLMKFLQSKGGIGGYKGKDVGELKHLGVNMPGLINKDGMALDRAVETAWEAGYFPEFGKEEPPSVDDLLAALGDELAGTARYAQNEAAMEAQAQANNELDQFEAFLAENGLNIDSAPEELAKAWEKVLFQPAPPGTVAKLKIDGKAVEKVYGKALEANISTEDLQVAVRKYFDEVLRQIPKDQLPNFPGTDEKVYFESNGRNKLANSVRSVLQARMVEAIPQIIETGIASEPQGLNKARNDKIKAFYWITNTVELDGETYNVGVSIYERGGKKFYNLNADIDAFNEARKNRGLADSDPSLPTDLSTNPHSSNIAPENSGVNITVEKVDDKSTLFQPAFHGSPYYFDKFSLEHLGKGEGAQAFGWGLYFAGKQELADWYRAKLSKKPLMSLNDKMAQLVVDGQPLNSGRNGIEADGKLYDLITEGDNDGAIAYAEERLARWVELAADESYQFRDYAKDKAEAWGELLPKLKEGKVKSTAKGQVYKVEIPEDDTMLLWDATYDQQPEAVQGLLFEPKNGKVELPNRKKVPFVHVTGKMIYEAFVETEGSPEAASKYLHSLGIQGIKYLDGLSRDIAWKVTLSTSKGEYSSTKFADKASAESYAEVKRGEGFETAIELDGSYNYVIFDDNAIEIVETYYQGKRGAITKSKGKYVIHAFASARDPSTVPHELAHFFLYELWDLVKSAEATAEAVQEFETLREWLKIGDDQATLTVDQQEQFARGFEAYLMEGRAPSKKLAKVFARFSKWLVNLYKSVKALDVQLNDDVRRFYDRMLAVDEEVEAYVKNLGLKNVSNLETQALGLAAGDAAYLNRMLENIKGLAKHQYLTSLNANYKELLKAWRSQAEEKAKSERVYRLRDHLAKEGGLSRDDLRDQFGPEVVSAINKRRPGIVRAGGIPLGVAASDFGYATIAEMVDELTNAPSRSARVEELVGILQAQHDAQFAADAPVLEGESLTEYFDALGKYITDANAARAEGEAKAKRSEQEKRDALAKALADEEWESLGIKQFVEKELAGKKVSEATNVRWFLGNLKQQLNRLQKALLSKSLTAAQDANRKVKANHQFARQAVALRDEVMRFERLAKDLARNKGTIEFDHLEKIKALLVKYGLTKVGPVDPGDVKGLEYFSGATYDEIFGDGEVMKLPEWLDLDAPKNYRDLTVDEFRELVSTVQFLEKRGREALQGRNAKLHIADMSFDEAMLGLLETIKPLKSRWRPKQSNVFRHIFQLWRGLDQGRAQILYRLKALDGFTALGPDGVAGLHETLLFDSAAKAVNKERALREGWGRPLMELLQKQFGDRLGNLDSPDYIKTSVPVPKIMAEHGADGWTFANVLAIALNVGNEHNFRAILEGYDITASEAYELTKILTSYDWKIIQEVWNGVSEAWPALSQAYFDRNGMRPPKVEPSPFVNPLGEKMLGGYWPLKFDGNLSSKVEMRDEIQVLKDMSSASFGPAPKKGMVTARKKTSGGLPPLLDPLRVLAGHVDYVSKYVAWATTVRDLDRIFQDPEYQKEVSRVLGPEFFGRKATGGVAGEGGVRQLLKDLAGVNPPPQTTIEKVGGWLRSSVVKYILYYNPRVAVTQLLGLPAILQELGVKNYAKGIAVTKQFGPINAYDKMLELSPMMAERAGRIDQDLFESFDTTAGGITAKMKALSKANDKLGGFGMVAVDGMILAPAWWGMYDKTLRATGDEEAAVESADKLVRQIQPVSTKLDLSAYQRSSSQFVRMLTFFSSATLQIGNRYWTYNEALRQGKITPARFARHVLYERVLPPALAVVMASLFAKGKVDGDDDETQLDMLFEFLSYQFVGLPGIRDAATFASDSVKKQFLPKARRPQLSNPMSSASKIITDAFNNTLGAIADLDEKNAQKAMWSLAELIGLATGIPAMQVYRRITRSAEQIKKNKPGYGKYIGIPAPGSSK